MTKHMINHKTRHATAKTINETTGVPCKWDEALGVYLVGKWESECPDGETAWNKAEMIVDTTHKKA